MALNAGIPEEVQAMTYTFNYNDIESLKKSLDGDVAAVILEPVVFNEPKDNFLHQVAEVCKENGVLLIFDEMWSGFRMALGGAQEYFGIKPDMATYSKAIANGMPISVLTGRKDILDLSDTDVFFYTTFGGEALSLAATKATIEELRDKKVSEFLDKQGKKLKNGYNQIVSELDLSYTKAIGYNFRSMVVFTEEGGNPFLTKSFVQQELIKRGILWSGFHNISYSHTDEDVEYTLNAYKEILPRLKEAVENGTVAEQIKGEPVQPTFRKTSNFNTKPMDKK